MRNKIPRPVFHPTSVTILTYPFSYTFMLLPPKDKQAKPRHFPTNDAPPRVRIAQYPLALHYLFRHSFFVIFRG